MSTQKVGRLPWHRHQARQRQTWQDPFSTEYTVATLVHLKVMLSLTQEPIVRNNRRLEVKVQVYSLWQESKMQNYNPKGYISNHDRVHLPRWSTTSINNILNTHTRATSITKVLESHLRVVLTIDGQKAKALTTLIGRQSSKSMHKSSRKKAPASPRMKDLSSPKRPKGTTAVVVTILVRALTRRRARCQQRNTTLRSRCVKALATSTVHHCDTQVKLQ